LLVQALDISTVSYTTGVEHIKSFLRGAEPDICSAVNDGIHVADNVKHVRRADSKV
jgi:hypothetical protein